MKKFLLIASVAIAGLTAAGCASTPAGSLFGAPKVQFSQVNGSSSKVVKDTSTVVLGVFGTRSYPAAADVAKANGISKIASVEYYTKPGILFLWSTYETIVTGE